MGFLETAFLTALLNETLRSRNVLENSELADPFPAPSEVVSCPPKLWIRFPVNGDVLLSVEIPNAGGVEENPAVVNFGNGAGSLTGAVG